METKQPTTLAELKVISEKTGISLAELQQEYQIYEFSFSSCLEARENYHNKGGYKSDVFFGSEDDYAKPETVAYHKAWEEISLKEQPDVTNLNFEQSLEFIQVCFRKGPQLVALVETLEKNIGEDMAKVALFFKKGYTLTFYEHSECPIANLANRLIKVIDNHYQYEMNKTWNQDTLISLYQEMVDYKFLDVRPFPDSFHALSNKIAQTAKTISELHELKFAYFKLARWKELLPKTELKDILPTLTAFLALVKQADNKSYERPNEVWWFLNTLFNRCKTDSEARCLLDIGRKFFHDEEGADVVYKQLYVWTSQRLLEQKLSLHPKLGDYSSLFSEAGIRSAIAKKITSLWIEATKKALKKPIPSFSKLYRQAHESMKSTVLIKWNSWGKEQLRGVETWDELVKFDFEGLIPVPKQRYSSDYFIWSSERNSFSTFIMFLQRLTTTAVGLDNNLKVLNLILTKSNYLIECHAGHLLLPEITAMVRKIVATETVELDVLWTMYEKVRKFSIRDDTQAEELLADTLIAKDQTALEQIIINVKGRERLHSKYLKMKVEYAMR